MVLVVVRRVVILEDQVVEVMFHVKDLVTHLLRTHLKVMMVVVEVLALEEVVVVELVVLVITAILIQQVVQLVVMVDQVFQMQF